MKINKSTLFLSIIVVIIPILLFSFFLRNTRSIPEIKIVLSIENDNKLKTYNISDDGVAKLRKVIDESNYSINTDKLIQVFEREREHYIVLITIITLIITIFSIFMILNRFVEKDEYEKIKNDFEQNRSEFILELNELKFSNICLKIKANYDALQGMLNLIYKDGYVSNLDQFELFTQERFNKHLIELNKLSLTTEDIGTLCTIIKNYVIYSVSYANKKKWLEPAPFDVDKNILFKNLIKYFKANLEVNVYNSFKEKWLKLAQHNVNFGEF